MGRSFARSVYVRGDPPQNHPEAGYYERGVANFNFFSCVVAQPVDWLPADCRGAASIQMDHLFGQSQRRDVLARKFNQDRSPTERRIKVQENAGEQCLTQ